MKKYVITYDTEETINNKFEIEADFEQDAWDAFYYEIETETIVTEKHISEK